MPRRSAEISSRRPGWPSFRAKKLPLSGFQVTPSRPLFSSAPAKYPARQTLESADALARRHQLDEARFLLIANQKTTVSDIEKWTQLADYFGSDLDVWDVSYYGFFDLV